MKVTIRLAAKGGAFALFAARQDVAALEEGHGHGFRGVTPSPFCK